MRSSKVLTISVPPGLAKKVKNLSQEEDLSRSELVRQALREYMRSRERWKLLRKWGEESAKRLNLETEEDVAKIVEDFRDESQK